MENHFNDVHSNKDAENRISGIMGCMFRSIKGESCIKGYMNALRYAQCKNIEFLLLSKAEIRQTHTDLFSNISGRLFCTSASETVYAYRTMTRLAYRPFGCFRPGWIINITCMPNTAAVSKNYRHTKINTNMIFREWFSSSIIGYIISIINRSKIYYCSVLHNCWNCLFVRLY